jgi:hypothetical protein
MALQRSRDRLQLSEQFSPELLSNSLFVVNGAALPTLARAPLCGPELFDIFKQILISQYRPLASIEPYASARTTPLKVYGPVRRREIYLGSNQNSPIHGTAAAFGVEVCRRRFDLVLVNKRYELRRYEHAWQPVHPDDTASRRLQIVTFACGECTMT